MYMQAIVHPSTKTCATTEGGTKVTFLFSLLSSEISLPPTFEFISSNNMEKSKQDIDSGGPTNETNEIPLADDPLKEIGDRARRATDIEHQMTFMDGLRLYPASIGWSAFFSLGVIMC